MAAISACMEIFMNNCGYILRITGIIDRKAMFASALGYYSVYDVDMTTWGRIPGRMVDRMTKFRSPCSWFGRRFFYQYNWRLNKKSIHELRDSFCTDGVYDQITWGIHKNHNLLCLGREWVDISVDRTDLFEENKLLGWVDRIKEKGIITSFEKITVDNGFKRRPSASR